MKQFLPALAILSLTLLSLVGCVQNVPREDPPAATETLAPQAATQNIQRIKIATVGAKNLAETTVLYERWLDYKVVERGSIPALLATSWGAPNIADQPYALLQGSSGDDVFLRVLETPHSEAYAAMTTFGWNAIEIIVEDPDEIYKKLSNSPFMHVGGPDYLSANSSIRAVQFKGPSEEIFYFTTETGDRTKSTLLTPRAAIDRPFIMVVAGPDARALTDFYVETFDAKEAFFLNTDIAILAKAQGLAEDHKFEMGFVRLGEFSNSIEIDGYPESTQPRKIAEGFLPPGVSITSFALQDLGRINADLFISPPMSMPGKAYAGNRVATIRGPAGELIELIEEP